MSKIQKKIEAAKKNYPQLANINWNDILREDPEILNDVVAGIVRTDTKRKAKINYNVGTQKLHRLQDIDYSELPFTEAFAIMCGDDPLRVIAEKIGVSYSHVYNLRQGISEPSFEIMESIAEAYSRKPSFLLEYRIGTVLLSLEAFMEKNPETASIWYNRVYNQRGIQIK